ncbi:MAG: tripeptide aminopeptidase PepT [Spirochaetaceae bacterium]|jgi:tripeptide aminopeptidase|nr:tripeptide aminopeptidase PepT [Spirochaetaceae bacterium]
MVDIDRDAVLERFLRYVKVWTTSDKNVPCTPSTSGQWDLAKMLVHELSGLGIDDITLTGQCCVIARIPAATTKPAETIGFLAHLDTSEETSGKDVQPLVQQNAEGKTIITSGGDTLLGADDKAGIAEIVSAAEYLLRHPEVEHGPIELIFTPDEETGKPPEHLPRNEIRSTCCFTVDGGGEGEIEIECFNAYSVTVTFFGRVMHPGYARGALVNAALMAAVFAAMLPRTESPEATDGYYGYYSVTGISGGGENAVVELILRDFEKSGIERRLAALEQFARAVEAQFPGGTVSVQPKESYHNMRPCIEARPEILTRIAAAAQRAGVAWRLKPVRGGTDGARLCEMGIPTPNMWTGGHNFHSRDEWACLEEMTSACRMIVELSRCSSEI